MPEMQLRVERAGAVNDPEPADMGGYAVGREARRMRRPGQVSARYFQLKRAHLDRPCQTITALVGAVGMAGVIHPIEDRMLTLAELRRICGFPDDFVLTGTYEQAAERLGRAVPPPMYRRLARAIAGLLGGVETPEEAMDKPPYRIPSMAEIMATPDNGYTVASTFTGAGGSCLGFRWAGFRTLWASEFVPAARDTYLANFPGVPVDGRDVREVEAGDILDACGLQPGELDVLEGSPPCASFSTAGKRDKKWNQVSKYSDTEQRVDDLFFEYVRLVRGVRPKVFVAENVSGLVKGVARGYFNEILAALRDCGYRVGARLLDAQWLGVPQMRQRVIFMGVRADLERDGEPVEPAFPDPLPYRYTVREAIPWIVRQGDNGSFGGGRMRATDQPSPTLGASSATGNNRFPPSKVEEREVRILHRGGIGKGNRRGVDEPAETVMAYGIGASARHQVVLHGAAAAPDAMDADLAPTRTTRSTVRKLSIAELRRLGGFPDDFQLTGSYAQQWERIGRAVPPPMMHAVARTVRDQVLGKLTEEPCGSGTISRDT